MLIKACTSLDDLTLTLLEKIRHKLHLTKGNAAKMIVGLALRRRSSWRKSQNFIKRYGRIWRLGAHNASRSFGSTGPRKKMLCCSSMQNISSVRIIEAKQSGYWSTTTQSRTNLRLLVKSRKPRSSRTKSDPGAAHELSSPLLRDLSLSSWRQAPKYCCELRI